MSVRTRDWLKFGALVAMAFVFGLAFASALNLPQVVELPDGSRRTYVPASR